MGETFLLFEKNYLPYSLRKFRYAHLLRSQGDKISFDLPKMYIFCYEKMEFLYMFRVITAHALIGIFMLCNINLNVIATP